MVRSILVPLDGSTFGEHALPMAASIAMRAGATLHLAHVHQIVPPATVAGVTVMDSIDLHLRQDEQAYLADVARRLSEKRSLSLRSALLDGDVSPALCDYMRSNQVDLVVMSAHGRGALGRFWLGSVADELVRESPAPLLLLRPQEGKPDLAREISMGTILVPLDGTELAERILEPSVEMAKLCDSTLLLVQVIKPVIRPTYLPEGTTIVGLTHSVLEEINVLQKQQQEDALNYLSSLAAKLQARGVRCQTSVVVDEQVAAGILLEAQARHVDLISMETHARRGLSRLFLGSVADKIVRSGTVPVLLNHPTA